MFYIIENNIKKRTNMANLHLILKYVRYRPLKTIWYKRNTYINTGEFQFHINFRSPSSLWPAITSGPNIWLNSFKKQKKVTLEVFHSLKTPKRCPNPNLTIFRVKSPLKSFKWVFQTFSAKLIISYCQ